MTLFRYSYLVNNIWCWFYNSSQIYLYHTLPILFSLLLLWCCFMDDYDDAPILLCWYKVAQLVTSTKKIYAWNELPLHSKESTFKTILVDFFIQYLIVVGKRIFEEWCLGKKMEKKTHYMHSAHKNIYCILNYCVDVVLFS